MTPELDQTSQLAVPVPEVASAGWLAELSEARETNRRLNRRVQKLERRLNRWESRRYTVARWRRWITEWYCRERDRANRLEKDNERLRRLKWWRHLFRDSANGPDETRRTENSK